MLKNTFQEKFKAEINSVASSSNDTELETVRIISTLHIPVREPLK